MLRLLALCLIGCGLSLPSYGYVSGTPVTTDSRIKTFVYNPNDVYRLLTHYGYQQNIEFGKDEEITTVSLGNRAGWQITPSENRIYIRAMEDKSHTNMTVETDKRTYQFDLHSSPPGEQGWDELIYVVRFYYPEDSDQLTPPLGYSPPAPMMASYPTPPAMNRPMQPRLMPQMTPQMVPQRPMLPPMQSPMMAPQMIPQAQMPVPMMQPVPQAAYPRQSYPQMMPQQQPQMQPQSQNFSLPPVPPLPSQGMASGFAGGSNMSMAPVTVPALPPMAPRGYGQRPAYPVPQVNVAPPPMAMSPMSVAPMPRIPNPDAPLTVTNLNPQAQSLARHYPHGSYKNPSLAPRSLPSLSSIPTARDLRRTRGQISDNRSLPLPSAAPGDYIRF